MRRLLVGVMIAAAATACGGDGPPWFTTPRFAVGADTVAGNGSLVELRLQLDQWQRSRPASYSFDLGVSCFCGGDIIHPARVYVSGGTVTRVVALDDGRALDARQFPTIDAIFAHAITAAERGEAIRDVTYLRETGQIIHITVGTPENDAGTFYRLGAARAER